MVFIPDLIEAVKHWSLSKQVISNKRTNAKIDTCFSCIAGKGFAPKCALDYYKGGKLHRSKTVVVSITEKISTGNKAVTGNCKAGGG